MLYVTAESEFGCVALDGHLDFFESTVDSVVFSCMTCDFIDSHHPFFTGTAMNLDAGRAEIVGATSGIAFELAVFPLCGASRFTRARTFSWCTG